MYGGLNQNRKTVQSPDNLLINSSNARYLYPDDKFNDMRIDLSIAWILFDRIHRFTLKQFIMHMEDQKKDTLDVKEGNDPKDIEISTQLTIDEFEEEEKEKKPETVDKTEEEVEESVLLINPDKNSMESRG